MSTGATTAFDRVRAKEVVTPLVTMPAGLLSTGVSVDMDLVAVVDGDHPDLQIRDQNEVPRVIVHGTISDPTTEPALNIPDFDTQIGTLPLGGAVAFDADNDLVPITFADLADELGAIPADQTVLCLEYHAVDEDAPLVGDDAEFSRATSYTCVGQVAAAADVALTPVTLFTLTGVSDTSYTITVTSTVRVLDGSSAFLQSASNVGTITWNTGDALALNIENHSSAVVTDLSGTGVGNILSGILAVTPTIAGTTSVIVGFKVDVTRVPFTPTPSP